MKIHYVIRRFSAVAAASCVLALTLPQLADAQPIVIYGNDRLFLGNNQGFQVPGGIIVKDNGENKMPASLALNNGDVLLEESTASYILHSIPPSANGVFYAAVPGGDVGMTVVNGAAGVSDFTLKLEETAALGSHAVPVIWKVSQTVGSGFGNLIFSWDAALEPVTLPNKKLYVNTGSGWTPLPVINTTVGSRTLAYTTYNGALSSTRFAVASALSATATPTAPVCAGGTGSISISGSGGLGSGIQYKLGNGSWQSGNLFSGLAAGHYTVFVKDLAEELSINVTITGPAPVAAAISGTTVLCNETSTTLTASGGVSYLWSNSLGTNAAVTVGQGNYTVTVTDINGCTATASATVAPGTGLNPAVSYQENSGVSGNDGVICFGTPVVLSVSGGSSYAWSDGATTASRTITPSCSVAYQVTVSNAGGCSAIANPVVSVLQEATVSQITPLSGTSGTLIHIYGTNLGNFQEIRFNGQVAASLNIISSTHVTASLPFTGSLQQVSLLSPCGTQNVTVATPSVSSFTPGAGGVGTVLTLTGTQLGELTSAIVGGVQAVILSRSATSARVIVMPGASSGSITVSSATGDATVSGSFTVTATPYPYFQEGLKRSNSSTNANQGVSVAVSADGNTAVIGAPGDNNGVGAAWVYTRSGSTWTQQAKLVGTGSVGSSAQGTSVSVSADGNTAVSGGPADDTNTGAVWVFTRTGSTWTQQGNKLTGSGSAGKAQQGASVSISGDGLMLASGGAADNTFNGAVWTFRKYGTLWAQFGEKVTGTGAVGKSRQGAAVSLNEKGTRLLVGGYQDDNRKGAAWVFEQTDCGWNQPTPKLVGTGGGSSAWQGYSVSLSADGNTALIGGPNDNTLVGAAWIFGYSGGNWTQQARLVGTQSAGTARQGFSVSLSANGNTVVLGGSGDDANKGAVWVFRKNGNSWIQQGAKIKGSAASGSAKQGTGISLSANGHTALIGGPADNGNRGAFWVFVPPSVSANSTEEAVSEEAIPVKTGLFRLDQNIPNPASGQVSVPFSIPEAGEVFWKITEPGGREIMSFSRSYPAGENTEQFDLGGYDGVYFYSITIPGGILTKKMLIIR